MKEILKKVRKYEIEIRKHINNSYQGDYKSLFKGTGLDFDDTRLYNYGDDHRSINWKNSAKKKTYQNKVLKRLYNNNLKNLLSFFELQPEAVTKILIKVLNSKRPKERYKITIPTRLAKIMIKFLPTNVLDWIFKI